MHTADATLQVYVLNAAAELVAEFPSESQSTITDLRQLVLEHTGIPTRQQRILLDGEVLKTPRTLEGLKSRGDQKDLTFLLLQDDSLVWELFNGNWELSGDGTTIEKRNRDAFEPALGTELSSGVHHIQFTIDMCKDLSAAGIVFGVSEAAEEKFTTTGGGQAWGFGVYDSKLYITGNCYSPGHPSKLLDHKESSLEDSAKGSHIVAVVDMDNHSLGFRVNGGELYACDVALPDKVRPWVMMHFKGDKVTMSRAVDM